MCAFVVPGDLVYMVHQWYILVVFGSWIMKCIVDSYFQCLCQLQSRNKHDECKRQKILALLPSEVEVGDNSMPAAWHTFWDMESLTEL